MGISGMIGHKMFQVLNKNFPQAVFATTRTHQKELSEILSIESPKLFDLELTNQNQIQAVLEKVKPSVVINCTGITIRKLKTETPETVYAVNSVAPKIISFWCEQNNAKYIHFSTDCVFDGAKGSYSETDCPTATDLYGRSKYLGEIQSPSSLILRVPVIGRELFSKTELLEWFLSQKNKKISGYSEVYYSGMTTTRLAEEVTHLIKNFPELRGLYHISTEKISKYDLLVQLNQVFKNQTEITKDSSRKSDKSLACDKYMAKTKFTKPSWKQMLPEIYNENDFYERAQNVLSR